MSNSEKYSREHHLRVVKPNEDDLKKFAALIRSEQHRPVIEPASLQVDTWSQRDYHALWVRVMQKFVGRVVVAPGWQYSTGCAVEFQKALEHNIPVESVEGVRISAGDGLELLDGALREIQDVIAPEEKFLSVVRSLAPAEALHELPIKPSEPQYFRKDREVCK